MLKPGGIKMLVSMDFSQCLSRDMVKSPLSRNTTAIHKQMNLSSSVSMFTVTPEWATCGLINSVSITAGTIV
eukprot:3667892-Prorocentrum_lima.AAC.1